MQEALRHQAISIDPATGLRLSRRKHRRKVYCEALVSDKQKWQDAVDARLEVEPEPSLQD